MNNTAILILDEFRNILALIAAELLLTVPSLERRKNFTLRLISSIIVCTALTLFYILIRPLVLTDQVLGYWLSAAWYSAVILLTGGLLLFCFKLNLTELFWILIASYAAQHLVYIIVNEFLFMGLVPVKMNFWNLLAVYAVVCAVLYFFLYKVFIPNIRYRNHLYIADSVKMRIGMFVFLTAFVASTFINQLNAVKDFTQLNYLSIASDFVNCLLVLIVLYTTLRISRINLEKEMMQKLLNNEKKQYETFKSTVDYINVKCHDLKHEISLMQKTGQLNVDYFEEATKNIAIYESFAKTGNETLDILFTDKSIVCLANGIAFSYMADAKGLSKMYAGDIYTLFSNLIDNAIEYVKRFDNVEKRFIRLFIKPKGKMMTIHQENYFEGELVIVNGNPQTTKEDKIYHGFGVKSMRLIAQKYGGSLMVSTADHLFKIDLIVPFK